MKIKQIVFNTSNKLLPTSIYTIIITKVNSRKNDDLHCFFLSISIIEQYLYYGSGF